jgi:signal recognition particle subunit SRP54
VRARSKPDTTFLVCDAMTGQDAVRSASAFIETLPLDGVILTKLDGDTRGGAALSVRHVTGAPVRFVGTGEKVSDLQRFHADRMVSRVLGMGDVVSLVEKAQDVIDEAEAEDQMKRMMKDRFTLDDFMKQLQSLKKMGSMKDLLSHMPGMPEGFDASQVDERRLDRTQAVMLSMTPAERRRPEQIDMSRKRRIARGSGTTVNAVNELLKQFDGMRKMMSKLKKGGLMGRLAGKLMPGMGGGMPDVSEMMPGGAGGLPQTVGSRRPGGGGRDDRRKARKAERKRRKQSRRH